MTPHAFDCPEADRLVDDALRAIGAEIDALQIPRLLGVVLGGGYARGEGGVIAGGLSNDLDFYVVAEDGSSGAELAEIAAALRPVSEKWSARLGVDVDFSPPKTPWRIAHDAERLMIQELLHGYCDVSGKPGEELFKDIPRRPPEAFPFLEAVRLLVNRGAGLLLAAEPGASPDFVARNVNKAILGCGDARLIAEGRYRWRALDRADALADDLYRAAVQWKFRPRPEPPCDWEAARERWLGTVDSVCASGGGRRTLRAAARWLVRRRSPGPAPLRTLGLDPLVRILRAMRPLVRDRKPFPASLRRDWEVFN
ncbi:MAG: hypothetical protein IJK04_15225 [Kiritimatiellae bacterium]|nr:hypothetical protein [Kiritimatiellia bacterium]MBQ6248222.1 hypothetical protein [Kiritimatiellia bacterium]